MSDNEFQRCGFVHWTDFIIDNSYYDLRGDDYDFGYDDSSSDGSKR
jgi:hypothetical protein